MVLRPPNGDVDGEELLDYPDARQEPLSEAAGAKDRLAFRETCRD